MLKNNCETTARDVLYIDEFTMQVLHGCTVAVFIV